MRESDKIKEKTAGKQDLENTLSFYNDAMTKKVVGQLFDEYVKEDEDLYFTRNIEKNSHSFNGNNNDYNDIEDYDNSEYGDYDINNSNSFENGGYYFGDTFNSFSKEDLLPDYNNIQLDTESNDNNNYNQSIEKFPPEDDLNKNIDYENTKTQKIKKEYYEYDDFDDDFDQYDYEPKKKAKKIKPKKEKKYNDDYEEYDDVLDKYSHKNKKTKNDSHKNTQNYNIIIKDLSLPKEKKSKISYNENLPPLKNQHVTQKELNYEDVMRYSPRRRGGRNQTTKKKKRIPLSKNKSLYTNNYFEHTSKRKNQAQKSRIIIHSSNVKKRKVKINKFFLFLVFILTIALIFCVIRINNLKTEINSLKSAKANYQSEIILPKRL